MLNPEIPNGIGRCMGRAEDNIEISDKGELISAPRGRRSWHALGDPVVLMKMSMADKSKTRKSNRRQGVGLRNSTNEAGQCLMREGRNIAKPLKRETILHWRQRNYWKQN